MNTTLQQAIFDHIRRQVPPEQKLADVLSGLLHLQKGAVYKRLSGATPLTLEELAILAEHFTLPVHELFYPDKPMFMAEFSAAAAPVSVMEYLHLLDADLSPLAGDPSARVWHVTVGLPDFYYYYFEELTLFQVFTWERMVWRNPAWQHRRFSLDVPEKKEIMTLATRLAHFFLPAAGGGNMERIRTRQFVSANTVRGSIPALRGKGRYPPPDGCGRQAGGAPGADGLPQPAFRAGRQPVGQ